jgi:hypothetical protein
MGNPSVVMTLSWEDFKSFNRSYRSTLLHLPGVRTGKRAVPRNGLNGAERLSGLNV